MGGFPRAWLGALASMSAAIKLFALFPCPRSRRRVGTAEQNRASGQRGQRAGIPFAAGRATGQCPRHQRLAVADVSRVPRGASGPQKWGTKGLGTGAQRSGVHLVRKDQDPDMNLKTGPECKVRPAISTPGTPPAPHEFLVTKAWDTGRPERD